jgi:sterol desaturase/sphingolipid hydroxylase (fatty acid hydroxylase superfamily)
MNRIGGLFIALTLLSAVFWVIESLFAANPHQPRFYRRRGFRTDLAYWFLTPLVTKSISQIGLAVILIVLYRRNIHDIQTMLTARDTLLARQALWLQAIEMVFVGDFAGYWTHRWFHSRRMWAFHAIHHGSRELDWLSAARVHPVNDWLSRWIQTSLPVVLGFSPVAIAAYLPFLTFYAILLHANVSWGFGQFGWLIVSPSSIDGTIRLKTKGWTKTLPACFRCSIFCSVPVTCRKIDCPNNSASTPTMLRKPFGDR